MKMNIPQFTKQPPRKKDTKILYCIYTEHYILTDEKVQIKMISGVEERMTNIGTLYIMGDKEFSSLRELFEDMEINNPKRLSYLFDSLKVKTINALVTMYSEPVLLKPLYDVQKYQKISFKILVTTFYSKKEAEDYLERMKVYFPKRYFNFKLEEEELEIYALYLLMLNNLLK